MKRSTDRILTTHVGSLIRPQPLQAFLRAKQAGGAFEREAYEQCLTEFRHRHRSPPSRSRHRRGQTKGNSENRSAGRNTRWSA
jgi:hypothetical protein